MARAARPTSRAPGAGRVFVVRGVVEELESGRPLAELVVRAFDKDLVLDDSLGYASTDAAGRFAIRFDTSRFQDFREQRPDLFLRVLDPSGTRLLLETSDAIRWDAKLVEEYRLRIPARLLGSRARGR